LKLSIEIFRRVRFPINTKNLKVVALSILAATTFWFFNALNKEYSATIQYPVIFDFDQTEYIETSDVPDKVRINVSGTGWTIFRSGYLFSAEPIFIDVENPERDNKLLGTGLFSDLSEGLSNLQLNYVLDDTILLEVERLVQKRVKLLVDSSSIQLSLDYYITGPIALEFDSVTLSGPRSYVAEMSDTLHISITRRNINESYSNQYQLVSKKNLVSVDSTSVLVSFDVEQYILVQKQIPLTKANFPDEGNAGLSDSTIQISYYIRASDVDVADKNDFVIVADYNRMVPYDSTIQPLILKHPEEIKRLKINSSRAKVILK